MLFLGATVMIAAVTATLNLDTSVAFLTPVLGHTARSRDGGTAGDAPADGPVPGASGSALLYACLLLSNAGSLLLPGSN